MKPEAPPEPPHRPPARCGRPLPPLLPAGSCCSSRGSPPVPRRLSRLRHPSACRLPSAGASGTWCAPPAGRAVWPVPSPAAVSVSRVAEALPGAPACSRRPGAAEASAPRAWAALPGTLSLQAVTITAPVVAHGDDGSGTSKGEDANISTWTGLAGAQGTCSCDRWGNRGLSLSQADAGDDRVCSGEMPESPGPGLWGALRGCGFGGGRPKFCPFCRRRTAR